jgi:putative transposase
LVQHRNNRDACFFCEDEYRYFLDLLQEGQGRFGVALHAYVLMTNHVHLLITPRDTAGISRLMQHLGGIMFCASTAITGAPVRCGKGATRRG